MRSESLHNESISRPSPKVTGLYEERRNSTEKAGLTRLRGALKRQPALIDALERTGFELDGNGLAALEETADLKVPSVPEQVQFVKNIYGEESAKRMLSVEKTETDGLREVALHGFDARHEKTKEHLERYVEDVLPAAWSDHLRSITLEARTPREVTKTISHASKAEWQGLVCIVDGQAEVKLSASLSAAEVRALCLTSIPDVLANLAIPESYSDQEAKARVERLYLVTQAVEKGMAQDFLPGLAAPRTAEEYALRAQAYEAALVRRAWSNGEGTQWTDGFQTELIEMQALQPRRAQFHAALAKRLLALHFDESVAKTFESRSEWAKQWKQEEFEAEVELSVKEIEDDSLRLALQDACLHTAAKELSKTLVVEWHPSPEVPVEAVPLLENWQILVRGIRLNLSLQRPLLDGLTAVREDLHRAWSHLPQGQAYERAITEARYILRSTFA